MDEEEIITLVIDEAFHIHKRLGPGMLENVYKTCLAYRLQQRGLRVETERGIPVVFEDVKMECGYRADMIVENKELLKFFVSFVLLRARRDLA